MAKKKRTLIKKYQTTGNRRIERLEERKKRVAAKPAIKAAKQELKEERKWLRQQRMDRIGLLGGYSTKEDISQAKGWRDESRAEFKQLKLDEKIRRQKARDSRQTGGQLMRNLRKGQRLTKRDLKLKQKETRLEQKGQNIRGWTDRKLEKLGVEDSWDLPEGTDTKKVERVMRRTHRKGDRMARKYGRLEQRQLKLRQKQARYDDSRIYQDEGETYKEEDFDIKKVSGEEDPLKDIKSKKQKVKYFKRGPQKGKIKKVKLKNPDKIYTKDKRTGETEVFTEEPEKGFDYTIPKGWKTKYKYSRKTGKLRKRRHSWANIWKTDKYKKGGERTTDGFLEPRIPRLFE